MVPSLMIFRENFYLAISPPIPLLLPSSLFSTNRMSSVDLHSSKLPKEVLQQLWSYSYKQPRKSSCNPGRSCKAMIMVTPPCSTMLTSSKFFLVYYNLLQMWVRQELDVGFLTNALLLNLCCFSSRSSRICLFPNS